MLCSVSFCFQAEYNAADVIVMTLIRCLAVLYSYYQLRNLHKLGSKYILGEVIQRVYVCHVSPYILQIMIQIKVKSTEGENTRPLRRK